MPCYTLRAWGLHSTPLANFIILRILKPIHFISKLYLTKDPQTDTHLTMDYHQENSGQRYPSENVFWFMVWNATILFRGGLKRQLG